MDPANNETDPDQEHGFNCIISCHNKFIVYVTPSYRCSAVVLQIGVNSSGQNPGNFSIAVNQNDHRTNELDRHDHDSPDAAE